MLLTWFRLKIVKKEEGAIKVFRRRLKTPNWG